VSEKKIKNSIDAIEPETGAKERMYQNILEKAQQSAPAEKKKKPVPFVRYALPVAACICLLVGAAGLLPRSTPGQTEPGGVQIANPFVEVGSAEDFGSIGITLDAPAGAQNVQYTIIDNEIAEVRFALDGKSYTARASDQSGDFSGLFGSQEEIETIDAARNAVVSVVQVDDTDIYKVTWTDGKVNYCLYGTDGADQDQTRSVYESVVN
jgi:hypothetical protein